MPLITEKKPQNPVRPLAAPSGGLAYFVKDGDSWKSIGQAYGLDPWDLISFNFETTDPDEVNWYLREYVGCSVPDPDRVNWRFTSGIKGGKGYWQNGVIYLPPECLNTCPNAECDFSQTLLGHFSVAPKGYVISMRLPTDEDRRMGKEFFEEIVSAAHERARRFEQVDPNALDQISDVVGFANDVVDISEAVGISLGTAGEVISIIGLPVFAYEMLAEIGRSAVAGDIANARRKYYRALVKGMAAGLVPGYEPVKESSRLYQAAYEVGYRLIRGTSLRKQYQLVVALIDEYYFTGWRLTQPDRPKTVPDYRQYLRGEKLYEAMMIRFDRLEKLIR